MNWPPEPPTWVWGYLDNDTMSDWSDNTNTLYLNESLLGPYLQGVVATWRCPADPSSSVFSGQRLPRVRSYAMNNYLNPFDWGVPVRWKIARKMSDLKPSETFVLIDEREDSIEDGYFVVDMDNAGVGIHSVPRNSHANGATLSFADGHSEWRKWLDPRTTPPLKKHGFVGVTSGGPANPDSLWLRTKTTHLDR
jgi:prepilin-type processing-associated H-X9-DG protein